MKRVLLLLFVLAVALSASSVFAYTVPNESDLLFGINTDSFPASGPTGNWTAIAPVGGVFNTIGIPTVDPVGITPVKWEKNIANGCGYYSNWRGTSPQEQIPVNGITAIAVVRPVSGHTNDRNWTPVIDVLFGAFRLGVRNDNRQVILTVSKADGSQTQYNSTATLPDGQSTVLSAVVQPSGAYAVYVNGGTTAIISGAGVGPSTLLKPYSTELRRTVCIGTSQDDQSATLNGGIGDVYMWKVALPDAARTQLENDLMAKFHAGAAYPASTITASAAAGGSISPTGTTTVQYEADKTYTVTKNYGYEADVVVDGISQGDIPSYTFNDVVTNHTITVTFTALPTHTISGHVDAAPGGGATVSVKPTPSSLPVMSVTTDSYGNYSFAAVPEGTSYVCASQTGYMISPDQTVALYADTEGINFSLAAKRNIPKMENLLFAADTNDMGEAGTSGNWNTLYCTYPGISVLTAKATPTVTKVRGIKYDLNQRGTGGDDGYRLNASVATSSIPTNGATIVAVVKPVRNSTSDGWNSVVDIFRDNLILGVKNNTGQIQVRRNGTDYWSANDAAHTLASGQLAILSLVVQPDGKFSVWASLWNSTTNQFGPASVIMSSTATSAFTAFVPAQFGAEDWRKWIDIGRNDNDGWSAFNGYIGDVFVYKTALSDADRATLEADINFKTINITTYNLTATAGVGGSISPAGVTSVGETDNQTYTITPNVYYDIADVVLDGTTHLGAVSDYSFLNVTAPHTIDASFSEWVDTRITGKVALSDGTGIAGATVTATGDRGPFTATTGADGTYSIRVKPGSTYTLTAAKIRYTVAPDSLTAGPSDLTGKDFVATYVGIQKVIDLSIDDTWIDGQSITSWTNTGVLGGAFVSDGNKATVAGTVSANYGSLGKKAVVFNNSKLILSKDATTADASLIRAPSAMTGNGTYTVFAQLCSTAALPYEQYYFAFAHNGGNANCAAFGYGISGGYGAVAHWGGTDMGWSSPEKDGGPSINAWHYVAVTFDGTVEKVFLDGLPVNSETKTLALYPNNPFVVGSRFGDDTCGDRSSPFAGAMTSLKVYDGALSAGQIAQLSGLPTATITATAGAGGTISPSGDLVVLANTDQTFTIKPNLGYRVSDVVVDGASQGAISTYTFPAVTGTHTISVTFAAVPQHTISGRVTNPVTGAGIAGAAVYFSLTPNAFVAPYDTATTDGSGNFSKTTYDGTIYVSASASGYYNSADKAVTMSGANVTGINFVLASNTRHTPVPEQLFLSLTTDAFPNSGTIGNWIADVPAGRVFTPINAPSVAIVDGIKWDRNLISSYTRFHSGPDTVSTPATGATIIVACQPVRTGTVNNWQPIVDIYRDNLSLGMHNADGTIVVRRNNDMQTSTATIPDGQKTVLSLVVQPDGTYKVYANGNEIFAYNTASAFNAFIPNQFGTATWQSYLNIGCNDGDGWATFNGNIGDVFVYKTALTDAQRTQLEWDLFNKFGIGGQSVTISGQVIDVNGNVPVAGAQVVVQVSGVDVPTIAAVTDSSGHYTAQARLNAGDSFTVHASKLNYMPGDSTPPITFDGSTTTFTGVDVLVQSIETVKISGTVTDFITGNPVGGLKLSVYVSDTVTNYPVTTQSDGTYSVDVGAGSTSYVIDLDSTNSPMPVWITDLAGRTVAAPGGLYSDVTGKDLLVSYPSTITGKVVASDSSAVDGYAIVATDEFGTAKSATTIADGTYTISVLPGYNYTVTAKKGGYVTMPGPQTVNVSAGNTSYSVGDFTAIPTTISGVLKDAATGQPIYNGVVQSGTGAMSSAVVTDNTGAFTLPAIGCGGVELFGDALGYHCKNYFVSGAGTTGTVTKSIALNAETETGVIVNGGFESVTDGKPTDWTEKWVAGGLSFASSTDVPDAFSGTYSVWYTGTASYSALAQYVAVQPNSLYTCYFKAKGDAEVTSWFPMISFRGNFTATDGTVTNDAEYKGWISGETGYDGYAHNPPKTWMQYLKFHTYSGDAIQPFVRIAPPPATSHWTVDNIAASFCFETLPPVGKGCYVDDVVIDRVDANEPLVTVAPDPNEPPATDVANLAALKAKADTGETVNLTGTVTVASKGNGLFFVGEGLYQSTIMVKANGHSVPAAGTSVTSLKGTVTKDSFNQYTLTLSADPASSVSGAVLKAVGANNRTAKTDASLLTKLVRVWGNVSGATIDDGYGNPITVKDASLGAGTVAVSGVLWKDTDGSVVLYQNLP